MNTTPRIKFLHIRRPSITLGQNGLTIERAGPMGGITVAYRNIDEQHIEVAFARCRKDERYTKKLGRDVAGQALLLKSQLISLEPGDDVMEVIAGLVYCKRHGFAKNLRAAVHNRGPL